MNKRKTLKGLLNIPLVLYCLVFISLFVAGASLFTKGIAVADESKRWTERFDMNACNWSSTGKNDWFILEPGYQQILEGQEDRGLTRLVITVENETRRIGNIETRIVE